MNPIDKHGTEERIAGGSSTSVNVVSPSRTRLTRLRVGLHKGIGVLLALNFVALWMVPVILQGQSFRRGVSRVVRPVYWILDRSKALRRFASKYIYRREVHVDYFAAAIFLTFTLGGSLAVLFTWQITYGSLPWWLIVVYYFVWVGPGARGMATAWTFAHREGHAGGKMYRPWLANSVGNFFENWLGVFYGTIPYNFTATHIVTHHRFNGGKGDPVYAWDLDRTRFSHLLLYQWRFIRFLSGFAGLIELHRESGVSSAIDVAKARLVKGLVIYWVLVPAGTMALLMGTGSSVGATLLFLFFIYLQPLLAMSTFLSIINIGQHAFLEINQDGSLEKYVTSVTILDGVDDSFGEDFHVAHHFFPKVMHDELLDHVDRERLQWLRCNGSVFERTTIFEIAIMVCFGQIDRLIRNHYVNFGNENNEEEITELFTQRAKQREMTYEEYEFGYRHRLRDRVRDLVRDGVCENENRAYVYQAHNVVQ